MGNDILDGGAVTTRCRVAVGDDLFLVKATAVRYRERGGVLTRSRIGRRRHYRFAATACENTSRHRRGGGFNRIVSGAWFGNMDFSTTEGEIARIGEVRVTTRSPATRMTTSFWGWGADHIWGWRDDLFLVEGDSGSDTVSGGAALTRSADQTATTFFRFASYSGENTSSASTRWRIQPHRHGAWLGNLDSADRTGEHCPDRGRCG